MEEIKEVKPVRIDYKCPKCKTGYMRPTGIGIATNPPQYPHRCNMCECSETFTGKMYPYIEYINK